MGGRLEHGQERREMRGYDIVKIVYIVKRASSRVLMKIYSLLPWFIALVELLRKSLMGFREPAKTCPLTI